MIENVVAGYVFYMADFDKKENMVKFKTINVNPFKCVASHKDFAVLVQNVLTYRELIDINAQLNKYDSKELKFETLTDRELEDKAILTRKRTLVETFQRELITEIPKKYENVKVTEYPKTVLLLAGYVKNIIPAFPVEKIKTLANNTFKELADNGKADLTEDFCKEVAQLLKDYYSPMYSTDKDSIFKKWVLNFDIKGIRQLLLTCGFAPAFKDGRFTYEPKTDDEIRKNVAHALLRRMQKDVAECDKKPAGKTKKDKAPAKN